MQDTFTQLRKGTLELCLLARFDELGESYGYEIFKSFEHVQSMSITEGTLYPALVRLHKRGLLSVRKVSGGPGPPRRYYALTLAGEARYQELRVYWAALVEEVSGIIEAKSSDSCEDISQGPRVER